MNYKQVLAAVARGWCTTANANKTMDIDLTVAIAQEVMALIAVSQAAPTPNAEAPPAPSVSGEATAPQPEPSFSVALRDLLNRYSLENGSNTPDFLLADYLIGCLDTFNSVVNARTGWFKQARTDWLNRR